MGSYTSKSNLDRAVVWLPRMGYRCLESVSPAAMNQGPMCTLGEPSLLVQELLPAVVCAVSKAQEAGGSWPTTVGLGHKEWIWQTPLRTEQ